MNVLSINSNAYNRKLTEEHEEYKETSGSLVQCSHVATWTIPSGADAIDSKRSDESLGEDQGSSDEAASPTSLIPLEDIVLPPDFIFPNFKQEEGEKAAEEWDIFGDNRTISKMWNDFAKSYYVNYSPDDDSDQ